MIAVAAAVDTESRADANAAGHVAAVGSKGRHNPLPRRAAAAAGMGVALPDQPAQLGLHPLQVDSQPEAIGTPAAPVVDHAAAGASHPDEVVPGPVDEVELVFDGQGIALIVARRRSIADIVIQLRR